MNKLLITIDISSVMLLVTKNILNGLIHTLVILITNSQSRHGETYTHCSLTGVCL